MNYMIMAMEIATILNGSVNNMDFWKTKLIENFNMEMVARDLLDLIDEDTLYDFIISEFNENFTYEELYKLFSKDMNKEDLKDLLTEMGHDFVELEEL